MAIATLSSCYNNPMVFQGVVKIRKGQAVTLMMEATNMGAVQTIIAQYSQEVGVSAWLLSHFQCSGALLTRSPSLSADCTEGLPHRPVTGQDPAHPGCHQGQVGSVAVQPPHQDPPPVAHVPVCCHAARRPQLAVPQHHCSAGAGHRRHARTVKPLNQKTSLPKLEVRVWSTSSHFALFIMAITGPWTCLDCGGRLVAGRAHLDLILI